MRTAALMCALVLLALLSNQSLAGPAEPDGPMSPDGVALLNFNKISTVWDRGFTLREPADGRSVDEYVDDCYRAAARAGRQAGHLQCVRPLVEDAWWIKPEPSEPWQPPEPQPPRMDPVMRARLATSAGAVADLEGSVHARFP